MARLTTIMNFRDRATRGLTRTAERLRSIRSRTDELNRSTASVRSQVGRLAAEYRRQGMSASDAMRRAWEETERTSRGIARIGTLNPFRLLTASASGFFNFMRKQIFSIRGLLTTLGGAAFLKLTIGGAAEIERQILTFSALLQSEFAGQTLFDTLTEKANNSIFALEDFGASAQRFLTFTKDLGQIEELIDLTERLSFVDLTQGFEGAAFAVKELLGADFQSLKERFGISTRELKAFGVAAAARKGDVEGLIESFDRLLTAKGFTAEFVAEVNESGFAQIQNLLSNITTQFKLSGEAGLQELLPSLKEMNKAFREGDFDKFFRGLGILIGGLINGLVSIGNAFGRAGAAARPVFDFLTNTIAWVVFVGLPGLAGGIDKATEASQGLSSFIQSAFPILASIIIGLGTAFAAYKAVVFLATLVTGGFELSVKAAAIAMRLFNFVMALNPIGIVIGLVIGLIVAVTTLTATNEKFRRGFASVFGFVVDFFEATVNFLIRGFNLITQAQNSVRQFMIDSWASVAGFVLDKVDDILEALNKIPGIDLDVSTDDLRAGLKSATDFAKELTTVPKIAATADFSKFKEAGQQAIESFDAAKLVDKIKSISGLDFATDKFDVALTATDVEMQNATAQKFTTPDFAATGENGFTLNEFTIDDAGNIIDAIQRSAFVERPVQDNRQIKVVVAEEMNVTNEADEDRLVDKVIRAVEDVLTTEIDTESDLVVEVR